MSRSPGRRHKPSATRNRRRRSAIRRLDLQTEVTREPEPFRIRLPPELLWFVIAVALGALLYSFRDMIPILRARGSESWTETEEIAADIARRDPTVVLAAADELAREGRYAEAMHVLLLRGLADIRARLDEPFANSLTSREILRSTRLPEQGSRLAARRGRSRRMDLFRRVSGWARRLCSLPRKL